MSHQSPGELLKLKTEIKTYQPETATQCCSDFLQYCAGENKHCQSHCSSKQKVGSCVQKAVWAASWAPWKIFPNLGSSLVSSVCFSLRIARVWQATTHTPSTLRCVLAYQVTIPKYKIVHSLLYSSYWNKDCLFLPIPVRDHRQYIHHSQWLWSAL